MPVPLEIDVKRFYLPGVGLSSTCPGCGEGVAIYFTQTHCLSYPTANEDTEFTFYHGDCSADDGGTEWTVKIRLVVDLLAVEGCERIP
jgi:hypothetical protein